MANPSADPRTEAECVEFMRKALKLLDDISADAGPEARQLGLMPETARKVLARIDRLQAALGFAKDLAGECMENGDVRFGQAAEVAMRHIWRRADETL